MDYSSKTRKELTAICKETGIRGHSGKTQEVMIQLVNSHFSSKKQDTGKFRTNMKDQFYTIEPVVLSCVHHIIDLLPFACDYIWVEPSAGSGSFLHNIPNHLKKLGLT